MKITTSVTWSMATGEVLDHQWHEYAGTVELCKGDGTAKDQLKLNNQLVQDQLKKQAQFQDPVLAGLSKYLSGDVGFTPEQMALLNSSFLNQQSQRFNQAGQQVRSSLASRGEGGGDAPVGGNYAKGIAGLEGMNAATTSGGLRDIQLQNIQQALQNKFNTANAFLGNASIQGQNIGTFSNGSNNSLAQYVNAKNQGFGNAFSSGFGKSIGGGIGNVLTGGSGSGGG